MRLTRQRCFPLRTDLALKDVDRCRRDDGRPRHSVSPSHPRPTRVRAGMRSGPASGGKLRDANDGRPAAGPRVGPGSTLDRQSSRHMGGRVTTGRLPLSFRLPLRLRSVVCSVRTVAVSPRRSSRAGCAIRKRRCLNCGRTHTTAERISAECGGRAGRGSCRRIGSARVERLIGLGSARLGAGGCCAVSSLCLSRLAHGHQQNAA